VLLHARRGGADKEAVQPWPVLVVDDEPDVHAMTRVLLRDLSFQGRGFEVLSASSAAEARAILAQRPDIPVALLDVVMETPDAGLELVRHIRYELGNSRIAIVLRTGQPAEAPEREVMLAYDINDYRGKTELTAQKLFTALVGGLRSWTSLTTIETLNATLEQRVIERTAEVQRARLFAESLVDMLPHPVWYKGADGQLRLTNRAFRDMFGGAASIPESLAALDKDTDLVAQAQAAGVVALEANLEVAGQTRTVMISKSLLPEGTSPASGTIGLITDITQRKRMEHQLFQLATTDDLTGMLNRRAFFSAAEQEIERSLRYGNPVSVLMLDLDHFKRVNDDYGHAMGDQALKAAAVAMAASLREVDILGRLGGEEFAILLPETPLLGAQEVAERLRQAVAAIPLRLGDGAMLWLTASLGVAERLGDESSVDAVLARADAALYQAKHGGRNRVCCC
jgi:diguanylate cyclase (GGDEF)-like protein